LEGSLHPSLGSLGQFLWAKIKFSKFSDYKRHVLRFISMLTKEKILFVSICNPTMPKLWQAKKPL
jgi:hypothetical protein